MKIAHLQKTSFIEYPGKISAVIFTQGCNLKCPYCHNPELVEPGLFTTPLSQDEILSFMMKRKGKLDGVVITGGEPALQKGLIEFMHKIKDIGFLIKFDTNGTFPDVLENIIEQRLADYIAMDIKGPAYKYPAITGARVDMDLILRSIRLVMNSGIDYEFRTTWAIEQLTLTDIEETATMIRDAKRFALQRFNPSKHLDPSTLNFRAPTDDMIRKAVDYAGNLVGECIIR
ncbi:MAG TPA: anaerobic ribonucleoside-triphosphate reductase activating protein [Desulfomonilia bacterium]